MQEKLKDGFGVSNTVIRMANECSPAVGKRIIEQYQSIPFVVRDAVADFHKAMEQVEDRDSIDAIKESLKQLANACEANPSYKDVYEAARNEAQEAIADVIANEGMNLLEDDE
jgi:hypothetical protein